MLRGSNFLFCLSGHFMPFYILHQTVILVVGFFVIPLELNVPTKLAIIVPSSFVGILAIYWLVKQVNVLRFLFGR
jgi:glucans biosynthesis protein C